MDRHLLHNVGIVAATVGRYLDADLAHRRAKSLRLKLLELLLRLPDIDDPNARAGLTGGVHNQTFRLVAAKLACRACRTAHD